MYNPKEQVILRHLMGDTDLAKQYLPYLNPEYFTSVREGKTIFTTIKDYVNKYDVPPSYEEFTLELHGKVDPDVWQEIEGELKEIQSSGELIKNRQYIKDEIEAFVRDKYQCSVMLDMIQNCEKGKPVAAFAHKLLTPPLMDVVAPGIDTTSPDFISRMFAHNHETACLIPFDIQWLNDTVRGVKRKTMNVILAPTNTEKACSCVIWRHRTCAKVSTSCTCLSKWTSGRYTTGSTQTCWIRRLIRLTH